MKEKAQKVWKLFINIVVFWWGLKVLKQVILFTILIIVITVNIKENKQCPPVDIKEIINNAYDGQIIEANTTIVKYAIMASKYNTLFNYASLYIAIIQIICRY